MPSAPTPLPSRIDYEQVVVANHLGVISFDVLATFTPLAGDLPDGVPGVFVKRAVVPDDPKSDEFVRVAVLSDLGKAATTRDIALDPAAYKPAADTYITSEGGLSNGLYLSATITLKFDSVQAALDTKPVLEQRIDSLISSWRKYRTAFFPATQTFFPLRDAGLVAKAMQAYYDAVAALALAKQTALTAAAAVTAADAAYLAAQQKREELGTLVSSLDTANAKFKVFGDAYDAYFTGLKGRRVLTSAIVMASSGVSAADTYVQEAVTKLTTQKNTVGLAADVKQTLIDVLAVLASFDLTAIQTTLDAALDDELVPLTDVSAKKTAAFDPAFTTVKDLSRDLSTAYVSAVGDVGTCDVAKSTSRQRVYTADADVAARTDSKNSAYTAVLTVCPTFTPSDTWNNGS